MPHVQVVVDGDAVVPAMLGAALARIEASVSFRSSLDADTPDADAFVFIAREDRSRISGALQRVIDRACGAVVLGNRPDPRFASAPVDYADVSSDLDLAERIRDMIALRSTLQRVTRTRGETAERIQTQYARRAHRARGLMQAIESPALPRYGPLRFEALSRSTDEVSGDLYDIRKLDRHTVAVMLSDAEGHGLPAAMLNAHVERTLARQKRQDPGEALAALNAELLRDGVGEGSFATLVYATIDLRTLDVRLARGGAPYPIYRGPRGTLRLVRPNGPLVGVLPEARFDVARFRLTPESTLLLYSDGLEVVTAANAPCEVHAAMSAVEAPSAGATPRGPIEWNASAGAPDMAITATPWYHELSSGGVSASIRSAAKRHDLLRRLGRPIDDLTMLAIRVAG